MSVHRFGVQSVPSDNARSSYLDGCSQTADSENVFASVLYGRKCWKTCKGGETVWPPELEEALIEGLERYRPDDSRETRLLGRFPMRNKFISEYIYQKTGKRRTAKQVGSRLQQLRDTCGSGKRLLHLLIPCRPLPRSAARENGVFLPYSKRRADSDASPTSEFFPQATPVTYPLLDSERSGPPIVFIDIMSDDASDSEDASATDQTSSERPARRIHDIDPTVTFVSPNIISAQAFYTVYANHTTVSTGRAPLRLRDTPAPTQVDGVLYSTPLAPDYWKTIAEASDPTEYSILQEVVKENDELPPSLAFSMLVKFRYSGLRSLGSSPSSSEPPSSPGSNGFEDIFCADGLDSSPQITNTMYTDISAPLVQQHDDWSFSCMPSGIFHEGDNNDAVDVNWKTAALNDFWNF